MFDPRPPLSAGERNHGIRWLTAVLALLAGVPAWAQAPALMWSNNIGARVFAVDAQTNVYAYTNGTVIQLNGAGVVVQTNNICPLPGIPQRDPLGNYIFAGHFDGTQDFGGITLVGGCLNCTYPNQWTPGWPTCFLAKYSSNGVLQWVTNFHNPSQPGTINRVDDTALNPDGSVMVAFDASGINEISMFSPAGTNLWISQPVGGEFAGVNALTICGMVGTNGYYLRNQGNNVAGGVYDASGNLHWFTPGPVGTQNSLAWNAKPVAGTSNNIYLAGLTEPAFSQPYNTPFLEQDLNSQTLVWDKSIGTVEQWVLAGDNSGNLFLGGTNGLFSKYDGSGTIIWSTNFGTAVVGTMVDPQGNVFLSFANGAVARLQGPPPPPMLSIQMSGNSVQVSWSSSVTNCMLKYSTNQNGIWSPVPATPVTNGNTVTVTDPYSGPSKIYRLFR